MIGIWGWSGSSHGAEWQEHRNAGFRAFDSSDYPKAVEQFEAALYFADETQAEDEQLGVLLEHLATAYLADKQYRRAQESIDRWDEILAANEDQAWAADHRVVRDKLAAYASKATAQALEAPASTSDAPIPEAPAPDASAPQTSTAAVTPSQPPEPEPVPSAASETYGIHLVSAKSEDNAVAAWETLKERHPILLEGKRLAVRQIDLDDRGIFYRVVALPFESATSAKSACAQFSTKDQYCAVMSGE